MWNTLLSSNDWGYIGAFALGVIYMIVHRGAAMSQAKKTAMTLMLAAETKASQLLLTSGQDKFDWVIDKGYDLLPAGIRLFISKPRFRTIVQQLFDQTVKVAKQYIDSNTSASASSNTGASTKAASASGSASSVPKMPRVPPIPPLFTIPAQTSASPAGAPASKSGNTGAGGSSPEQTAATGATA